MSKKVESDIMGAASILGTLFGFPEVTEAVEKAKGATAGIPDSQKPETRPAPKENDAETLTQCEGCGTFYLGDHDCANAGLPVFTYHAKRRDGRVFVDAGEFAGVEEAFAAAGSDGFVTRKEKKP